MRFGSQSGISSGTGLDICLCCGRKAEDKEGLTDGLTVLVCLLFGKTKAVTVKSKVFLFKVSKLVFSSPPLRTVN